MGESEERTPQESIEHMTYCRCGKCELTKVEVNIGKLERKKQKLEEMILRASENYEGR